LKDIVSLPLAAFIGHSIELPIDIAELISQRLAAISLPAYADASRTYMRDIFDIYAADDYDRYFYIFSQAAIEPPRHYGFHYADGQVYIAYY
jgi:hypothetical protein